MKLSDLDHLRDDKRIKFKEEVVNNETVTIVSYMVADNELWEKPLATECRGITFDSNGVCISRPFHKFFNVNENKHTQLNDIKNYNFEVFEKRDGSMVTPVLVNGKINWKTKKSFYSDIAKEAGSNVPQEVEYLSSFMLAMDFTPIFEYTSKNNRVVIDYEGDSNFVLLSIRHNESGMYASKSWLEVWSNYYNVSLINSFDMSLQDCIRQCKTKDNFEGWVLRGEKDFHVKLKTDWYLAHHRARTQLRERDIADMVIDETIDDIKSFLATNGYDLTEVNNIEHNVNQDIIKIQNEVQDLIGKIEDKKDFKSIALQYKDHPLFPTLISEVRGIDFDYKKYWKNNFRKNYSLKCIYSNFRNMETEQSE